MIRAALLLFVVFLLSHMLGAVLGVPTFGVFVAVVAGASCAAWESARRNRNRGIS